MTIAREVMNMSPSTTTGDVSTTESVWNFLMDPLDVFRFRGMGGWSQSHAFPLTALRRQSELRRSGAAAVRCGASLRAVPLRVGKNATVRSGFPRSALARRRHRGPGRGPLSLGVAPVETRDGATED